MIKQDQRKLVWFTVMLCLSLRFFLFLPFYSTLALPTHHSCFPYRVLLTAGGGCKRDVKMWNHMLVSHLHCQKRQTACLSLRDASGVKEKETESESEEGISTETRGLLWDSFSTVFCSRALHETIAHGPCLPGSTPSALRCLPQGCCGVLTCTFLLPRGCCPPSFPSCSSSSAAEMVKINCLT